MESSALTNRQNLPTFSIVLETETLSESGVEELLPCLESLNQQEIPPEKANEILVLNSGNVQKTLLTRLTRQYPWLKVHQVGAPATLYSAKMDGAKMVTGEITVFWDSDCAYSPNWLKDMLNTFAAKSTAQIVAGETSMEIRGIYDMAMAIAHIFPRFTKEKSPYTAPGYYANNVAFRREFLLAHPIHLDMPFNRGHCYIHALSLAEQGIKIWKHPKARATHAITKGSSFFFWRFLTMGYEFLETRRVAHAIFKNNGRPFSRRNFLTVRLACQVAARKFLVTLSKARQTLFEQPRHLFYFPIALPMIVAAVLLFWAGIGMSFINPEYLLSKSEHH